MFLSSSVLLSWGMHYGLLKVGFNGMKYEWGKLRLAGFEPQRSVSLLSII